MHIRPLSKSFCHISANSSRDALMVIEKELAESQLIPGRILAVVAALDP
jgi:hypothetical protein